MKKRQFVWRFFLYYFCAMPTITYQKRPKTLKFYACVRAEYSRLAKIKKHGKQKYTHECVIAELAEKFFKAERTIENIVFNRV